MYATFHYAIYSFEYLYSLYQHRLFYYMFSSLTVNIGQQLLMALLDNWPKTHIYEQQGLLSLTKYRNDGSGLTI